MVEVQRQYAKSTIRRRARVAEKLLVEFSTELDILSSNLLSEEIPQWVLDYREEFITKLSNKLCAFSRRLKLQGIDFKIKWPLSNLSGTTWRYADIYIPAQGVVILFNSRNSMHHVCDKGLFNQRAQFFRDLHLTTYELESSPKAINAVYDKLIKRHRAPQLSLGF